MTTVHCAPSLARLLGSAGFETEVFASAEDYLVRERYHGIACLILDVRMPGRSGLQLQDTLSEQGSDLPILFLTGHGDIPLSVRAIKGGAVNFLTKPVDEAVLLSAIWQALALHKKDRATVNRYKRPVRTCRHSPAVNMK